MFGWLLILLLKSAVTVPTIAALALHETPMRYDLTLAVKDLDGVQITDDKDTIGYTLRTVLVRTALFVDKAKLPSAEQKLTAYGLAKRIAQARGAIELSAEDVAFLKAQAGIMWTPLVLGQLFELLEAPLPKGLPTADIPPAS